MADKESANFWLRIGMALTLLWSVGTKLTTPDMVAGLFDSLGLGFLATNGVVITLGVILMILSVMLIFGWNVETAGMLLIVYFTVSTLSGLFAGDGWFSVGPAIWKDFALLGGAIALTVGGAGSYSIDEG